MQAYLLRTKLSSKEAETTASRSLNAQLSFVCYATCKAFYKKIPPAEITTTISLTCIIAHLINKHTIGRSK